MGKHVYTLNLRMEVESPMITDEESGHSLEVSPETLYTVVNNLRSEILTDLDELTAHEFDEAIEKATEVNTVLAQIEELEPLDHNEPAEEELN